MINSRIILFVGFCALLTACSRKPADNLVCHGDDCIKVRIADDELERRTGLQNVKELADDEGMFFVFFRNAPYAFWMKGTLIPLDIIWINSDQEVVHIEKSVPPCAEDPCPTYAPEGPARYVLEINAGKAEKMDLRRGAHLEFRLNDW